MRKLLMAVWSCLTAVVVVASLLPASVVGHVPAGDLLHAAGYLGLAIIPVAALERPRRAYLAAAAMALLGVALELLQIPIPGRAFEWKDVLANMAGVAAGILLGRLLRPRLANRAAEPEVLPSRE